MSTHPFSGSPLLHAFQKLLHSQYRYYTKELQALHKEMDDASLFMNQWVHQMKTPVSVMDLLLQNFDIQDQFDREFVNSMREELERLQHGLELALYSERIKRFSHDFHVKRLPLKTMVNHVIQHYKRSFIRNRIHPIVEIPETIFVETDQNGFSSLLAKSSSMPSNIQKTSATKSCFLLFNVKTKCFCPFKILESAFQNKISDAYLNLFSLV